ncbi:hypothetical protein K504DRAFT_449395 [Pleomassaria siparia CBS 279.74]|uniref:Uncharacterized protein n=1 Tax=Pleomassaria siparia CBS 279.74 TaxID=1314801 RepID=A0A6G1JVX7_9PLEO|nr:hypothetical protein K504DRAFT_449395 [Pleomassaria siparia CBS 279.74]
MCERDIGLVDKLKHVIVPIITHRLLADAKALDLESAGRVDNNNNDANIEVQRCEIDTIQRDARLIGSGGTRVSFIGSGGTRVLFIGGGSTRVYNRRVSGGGGRVKVVLVLVAEKYYLIDALAVRADALAAGADALAAGAVIDALVAGADALAAGAARALDSLSLLL